MREEILEDLDDEGRQIDADNLVRALSTARIRSASPSPARSRSSTASIAAMLKRHHARHYTAANSVLCFAGAVDPDACFRARVESISRRCPR